MNSPVVKQNFSIFPGLNFVYLTLKEKRIETNSLFLIPPPPKKNTVEKNILIPPFIIYLLINIIEILLNFNFKPKTDAIEIKKCFILKSI